MSPSPALPELRATYRLQLGPDLTFERARRLVPYLAELGVSHLYLSPVTQARSGSQHGYDVVDPRAVSAELGGVEGLRALAGAGLALILDVVPNHMAASEEENPFWRDPELRERFFDVDPVTGAHRRFFDVSELAGVRVEDAAVFETTHRLVLDLVADGVVDGLRVDHVDGLADPRGYLERLRAAGVRRAWVEKILEPGEQLRDWPVAGTTGYEFLNDAQALFVDRRGEEALTALAGEPRPFREVALEAKLEQARTSLAPELERLALLLVVSGLDEAVCALGVYRTYVEPARGRVDEADRQALAGVVEEVRRVLLLEEPGHDRFVTRFQQTTGAVMAKGVEDTAFYRYVRLLALNEVGGDPGRFGLSVEDFHAANAQRATRFPDSLLAGTTHDTKRSADVRARIGALAGFADEWCERALRWHALNEPLRRGAAPDWSEELLVYQTLLGAWPLELPRLLAYVQKALREAKRSTSWLEPDEDWEAGVAHFCTGLFTHRPFLVDFLPFVRRLALAGRRSSIGQLLLRLASPGVPDVYQGDELWLHTLVDPDNRGPVNWTRRRLALAGLAAGGPPAADTAKLHVLREALALRARRPRDFADGYEPLPGEGTCAFRRGEGVVVAVPLTGERPEFELPPGRWRDVLEGLGDAVGGYRPQLLEKL